MEYREARSKLKMRSSVIGLLIALGVLGVFALVAWSATLFEDDFTTPAEGWLSGPDAQGKATWSFSNGEYQVLVIRPDAVTWSLAPRGESGSEFCLEVDARHLLFSWGEIGLVFGASLQDNGEVFNTFGVFEDGSYRLGRFAQGELENLPVTTAPSKLYSSGHINNLRVVSRNGTVQFYGNGVLLATAEAEQLQLGSVGEIGFFGRSAEAPFAVGRFDYIRVMTPDCEF